MTPAICHAGQYLTKNAKEQPDAPAWFFGDRVWSWSEANERVNRLANALIGHGFQPGDKIALFSPNRPQLAECYFALAKAGLVAVPIHPGSIAKEVTNVVRNVGVRLLFVAESRTDRVEK